MIALIFSFHGQDSWVSKRPGRALKPQSLLGKTYGWAGTLRGLHTGVAVVLIWFSGDVPSGCNMFCSPWFYDCFAATSSWCKCVRHQKGNSRWEHGIPVIGCLFVRRLLDDDSIELISFLKPNQKRQMRTLAAAFWNIQLPPLLVTCSAIAANNWDTAKSNYKWYNCSVSNLTETNYRKHGMVYPRIAKTQWFQILQWPNSQGKRGLATLSALRRATFEQMKDFMSEKAGLNPYHHPEWSDLWEDHIIMES